MDSKEKSLRKAFKDIKFAISEQETLEFIKRQIDPLDLVVMENLKKAQNGKTN